MLSGFFLGLRAAGVPVSVTEYLGLLAGLRAGVAWANMDDFYHLARTALVKDERHYDRFDRVFGAFFRGLENPFRGANADAIPQEWLRRELERILSDEEKRRIENLGGIDKLMEALRRRLAEQRGRHQGGSKWIGTAGTSPFGAFGYHPQGVRIGQDDNRSQRAVKVWDRREFRNLDDSVELGTRNIKVALRRLRRFAREGAAEELDLDDTIHATARNAGLLDVKLVPERHNAVRVLLFLDVGGSMYPHVRLCEELFSAARSEFRHLEHFYFHNCVYESVWRDNRRRHSDRIDTFQLIRTYGRDYRLVLVGDASMSPYELVAPGGSVEHWNSEPGQLWLRRLLRHYSHAAWLNPEPAERWPYTQSIDMLRETMEGRMFPLTIGGLEGAIRALRRRGPGEHHGYADIALADPDVRDDGLPGN